jgi:hypothetical protein
VVPYCSLDGRLMGFPLLFAPGDFPNETVVPYCYCSRSSRTDVIRHILTRGVGALQGCAVALKTEWKYESRVDIGFRADCAELFEVFLKLAQALHVNEPDTG